MHPKTKQKSGFFFQIFNQSRRSIRLCLIPAFPDTGFLRKLALSRGMAKKGAQNPDSATLLEVGF